MNQQTLLILEKEFSLELNNLASSQGAPKPMSDCPGQVEIQFGKVNLWHNLSVGQAHF